MSVILGLFAGNHQFLDHILGAEATIVTSGNSVESVSCVPQDSNFVETEAENTPIQAQTPPRPGME